MNLLKSYVKRNVIWLCMGMVTAIVLLALLLLQGIPATDILYAYLLCFFLLLVFGGIDFSIYVQKHKQLERLQSIIAVAMEQLPDTADQVELDYQTLLQEVCEYEKHALNDSENKRKDAEEFFAMWVHQIKTPIAAMKLLLQMEEAKTGSELNEELFRIEQYVEIMLQYVRMNSETDDYVLEKQPLDPIIKEAVHKYAKQFIRKKLTLDYAAVDTMIVTDRKWLGFVIEQILSNAIKYTKKGKISIYVEAEKEAGGPILVIEDTGIGISSEDLPRIFDKGYTGYNGHNDKRSSGIGLYLCRSVLNKLSHRIEVESVMDEGTKVKIYLGTKQVME